MRRRKLLWQLAPFFLAVSLMSIAATTLYSLHALRRFHDRRTSAELVSRAALIMDEIRAGLAAGNLKALDEQCKALGAASDTRMTVVLPTGVVAGDSDESPSVMENHAGRPEIKEALEGRTGVSTRYSSTLRRKMMYAAIPLRDEGRIVGVLRTSMPVYAIEQNLVPVRLDLAVGALLLAVITGLGSLALSRWLSRPLQQMEHAAQRYAMGNFSHRVPVPDSEELGALADVLNLLARQLGEKIGQLERQGNERAAILASMIEGVVAIDENDRVIDLNPAAAALLDVPAPEAVGRALEEVVRNAELQKIMARAFDSEAPVEGDVVLYNGQERYLQVHGTPLRSEQGRRLGALVVLNDVTRLRKLENLRRDFVANVSHELKTPITSIKGFVETLQDGAINNPEDARRFLGIIAKQSDRLNAIIEDLLALSRLEQETERGQVSLEEASLHEVLGAAVQACSAKAEAKRIAVELTCPENLKAEVNAPLLEQAVINLIDNAVKYSEAGKAVRVRAEPAAGELVISVQDEGCGIDPEHLPRLFERFYRVDKGRSRQMGGTGLGLSIVKHIVQAHSGRVTVDSTPGKGSVFSLRLPVPLPRR